MEQLELNVEKRVVTGKQVRHLRSAGIIPAVVFGHEIGAMAVQIPEKPLRAILGKAGTNRLISLKIEGQKKSTLALVREVQRDSLTGAFTHVDFQAVVMTEKIRTTVRFSFVNDSPVVLSGLGMLLHGLDEVEIECLPGDLISSIEVDLAALKEIDDAIHVKDLQVPSSITVHTNPEDTVVRVTRIIETVEVEAAEAAEKTGDVEVIRKGKGEEEE
jgi:large subunit ribosomal protein L25